MQTLLICRISDLRYIGRHIIRRTLMITLLFILVFFLFQTFILLCCVAAGNDAASQEISDQEQMEFIREWKKIHCSSPQK